MGGCSWSQLNSCPGKELLSLKNRKLKINSVSISNSEEDSKIDEDLKKPPLTYKESLYLKRKHLKLRRKNSKNINSVSFIDPNSKEEKDPNLSTITNCKTNNLIMGIKLYSVSDSPPTLAVRMGLKYLGIDYEVVNVDYGTGEHFSPEFLKKNPQGEIPLLDDNGFLLSESVAILQYLAEKYKKDETFYPADFQKRALVNHRLAFHLSTYYKAITDYMVLPLVYAYPRTEENLKKVLYALKVLDEFFSRSKTQFVAGESLTIADLPLIMGTVCLECMEGFDLTKFPHVNSWYENFKKTQTELWSVAKQGLDELSEFEKNPPDLSHLQHPLHPTDKKKLK